MIKKIPWGGQGIFRLSEMTLLIRAVVELIRELSAKASLHQVLAYASNRTADLFWSP
jgi:hypothetical protein